MKNSFKLETVKWEWAKPVKNKSVYRDDQFIRSKSKEEAIAATDYLLKNHVQGLTYTITVFRDGEFFTYLRDRQPCYGSLCKYADQHGPDHHYNPYFPRDIYVAFPEGEITFIGVHRPNMKKSLDTPYVDFILSEESPWVSAFGNREIILTNMDSDPTIFYSLLRLAGFTGSIYDGGAKNAIHPKASILFSKNGQASVCRLAGQRPIKTSGGSWAEGFGYCRTYNESIFKRRLPDKFEDFKKHVSGYPQAPHNNKYFLRIMKENFGVDATKPEEKTYQALVLAWDFFKSESLKLGSGFPEDKFTLEPLPADNL